MGSLPQQRLGIEIHDAIHDRWVPVADLAEDFRSGTIQPFAGRRAAPSAFALNYPYDQAILTNLLNESGVIVLHAAAVILDGHGLALGGRSGIGKTTLARLCREAGGTLLNDDRCALFKRDGQWWITPTPWHGEEPEIHRTECRLSGIFHLERAPEPGARPLDPADGLARLLATGIAPFYRRAGLEKAMTHMADIVETVPSHAFRCHPDARAITLLRQILQTP